MGPLIYVLIALLGALLGGTSVIIFERMSLGKNASICVLGRKQTGKTLFFNGLRGLWSVEPEETGVSRVPAFKVTIKNSKGKDEVIKIKETKDIGGSEDFIASYYADLLASSTHIIYFCNIYEYMNDAEARKDVNARLEYIKKYLDDHKKKIESVFIVLSYGDMVDRKQAREVFTKYMTGESFAPFAKRLAIVNMTDRNDVEELIKNIFYVD